MTNTQVMGARRFATAAFAGVVALSLMLPTQLAFADYYVGEDSYAGDADASGDGSEGGSWSYAAEGQEMTLVDYIGESIYAVDQDLNIQLEGDSTVNGGIYVSEGDLTITGDDSVYGLDKPSLTLEGYDEDSDYASLSASGDLTIQDANIYAEAEGVGIYGENIEIVDSAIWRGDDNDYLSISAWGDEEAELTLEGSEVNATSVYSAGTIDISNTNLTVLPSKSTQEAIEAGAYDTLSWVHYAVRAVKGITLDGEANGEVIEYTDDYGLTWYYLYTGDDDKVELRSAETPAYWGPMGMPQTSDSTSTLVIGLSIMAACAGLAGAYSLRQRKVAGNHVK